MTGREVLLHLGELLARGYGVSPRLTRCWAGRSRVSLRRILERLEVHLLPVTNPDGWDRATEGECGGQVTRVVALISMDRQDFGSGRLNQNGVDINRDFPHTGEQLGERQPETLALAR